MKVPAISRDVYTSFGSSSNSVMRLAEACCFVFSIFTSLLFKENNATSAPDTTKLSNNKTSKAMIKRVVPCGVAASNMKRKFSVRAVIAEGLPKGFCFSE